MSNNSQIPFIPHGNTVVIAANSTAPTGIQAPVTDKYDAKATGQMRVVNAGTNTVHLGVGFTASEATANAVAAVTGTPSKAIPILPGAVEIMRFPVGSFFSGLASSATTVYMTPGQGI